MMTLFAIFLFNMTLINSFQTKVSWSSYLSNKQLIMVATPGKIPLLKSDISKNTNNYKNTRNKSNNYNNKGGNGNNYNYVWEHRIRKAIHRGDWLTAESFVNQLNSTELSSGRNAIYVITETCRRANELTAIVPLLEKIPNDIFICREDDILPMLNDCANKGQMRPAQRVLTFFENKQYITLTAKTYSVMLKGYGAQKNKVMVDNIMTSFLNRGKAARPDVVLLNSAMDAYIECNAPEQAVRLLKLLTSSSSSNDNNGYSDDNSNSNSYSIPQQAGALFTGSGIRPNTRTFNTLLKAFRGAPGGLDRAKSAVSFMRQGLNLALDTVTINTLIDVAVRAGELQEADNLLQQYAYEEDQDNKDDDRQKHNNIYINPNNHRNNRKKGPGVEAYTAVITGYAAQANAKRAFDLLHEMTSRGIYPNTYTITSLMTACVEANDMDRARTLLQLINGRRVNGLEKVRRDNNYKSNVESNDSSEYDDEDEGQCELAALHGVYITILSRLADGSGLAQAFGCLQDMRRMGLEPDTAALNSFIQSLFTAATNTSTSSSKTMTTSSASANAPEIQNYSSDTSSSSTTTTNTSTTSNDGRDVKDRSRIRQALSVLQDMLSWGFQPDQYSYSILFSALGKHGMLHEALKLFRGATARSGGTTLLDEPAINALIGAFVVAPDYTSELMERSQGGITSSSLSGTTGSKMHLVDSSLGKAISLYDELTMRDRKKGITEVFVPTKVTYTILLAALARKLSSISDITGQRIGTIFIDYDDDITGSTHKTTSALKYKQQPSSSSTVTEKKDGTSDDIVMSNDSSSNTAVDSSNDENTHNTNNSMKENSDKLIGSIRSETVDALLLRLFSDMRFEYDIVLDSYVISALNNLFSVAFKPSMQGVISKRTARAIFEDMYLCGWHPSECIPILDMCEMPAPKRAKLLASDMTTPKKSPASYRIFRKHGWNKMSSGWKALF